MQENNFFSWGGGILLSHLKLLNVLRHEHLGTLTHSFRAVGMDFFPRASNYREIEILLPLIHPNTINLQLPLYYTTCSMMSLTLSRTRYI